MQHGLVMMVNFQTFSANCKMRHDYGDMIQVRYRHRNGEDYDTWVSGDEVLSRLNSAEMEERLRSLRDLDWQKIKELKEQLPQEARDRADKFLLDSLATGIEDNIGGNIIGDSLEEAVRGRPSDTRDTDVNKVRWTALLHDETFRAKALELAWIQLEGSFPDEPTDEIPGEWV